MAQHLDFQLLLALAHLYALLVNTLSLELLLVTLLYLLFVLAALQVPRQLREKHQVLIVLHVQLVNLHYWDLLAQIV